MTLSQGLAMIAVAATPLILMGVVIAGTAAVRSFQNNDNGPTPPEQ